MQVTLRLKKSSSGSSPQFPGCAESAANPVGYVRRAKDRALAQTGARTAGLRSLCRGIESSLRSCQTTGCVSGVVEGVSMGAHRSWAGRAALDAIKSHRRGCDSAKQQVHIQRFVVPCVAMQQCTECSSGPDPTGTAD